MCYMQKALRAPKSLVDYIGDLICKNDRQLRFNDNDVVSDGVWIDKKTPMVKITFTGESWEIERLQNEVLWGFN